MIRKRWSLYAVGLMLVFGAIVGVLFHDIVRGATYGLLVGSIIYGISRKRT